MDKANFPKRSWTKNLSRYPRNFREEHILKFKDDNNEGMTKPHNLGCRIFKANKVQNALIYYDDNGNTYIKTKVHASVKRTIYTSGALINGDGEVIWGKCNCVGAIFGRCKHVFAMLWQMLDYVRDEKQFIEDTACIVKRTLIVRVQRSLTICIKSKNTEVTRCDITNTPGEKKKKIILTNMKIAT